MRRYERGWGSEDLPYVYGEQANTGFLAVASEKIGAFPLIEFSAEKGRRPEKRSGRADLQILTRDKKTWDIEAKRVHERFDNPNLKQIVTREIQNAVADVKDWSDRSDLAMGIVFVTPYGVSEDERNCIEFTDLMMDLRSIKADFCAVHLCRSDIWSKSYHKDCPGIAIVGKFVIE